MEKDPIYRRHDHHLMTFPIEWCLSRAGHRQGNGSGSTSVRPLPRPRRRQPLASKRRPARVEAVEVEPDRVARVVLNERTGTVVMGSEVSIGTVTRVGLIVSAAAVIVIGLVPPVTAAILEWTEAAAQGLVALIEF